MEFRSLIRTCLRVYVFCIIFSGILCAFPFFFYSKSFKNYNFQILLYFHSLLQGCILWVCSSFVCIIFPNFFFLTYSGPFCYFSQFYILCLLPCFLQHYRFFFVLPVEALFQKWFDVFTHISLDFCQLMFHSLSAYHIFH